MSSSSSSLQSYNIWGRFIVWMVVGLIVLVAVSDNHYATGAPAPAKQSNLVAESSAWAGSSPPFVVYGRMAMPPSTTSRTPSAKKPTGNKHKKRPKKATAAPSRTPSHLFTSGGWGPSIGK